MLVCVVLTTPRADCFDEADDDKAEVKCFGKEDITPIVLLVPTATWLEEFHSISRYKMNR